MLNKFTLVLLLVISAAFIAVSCGGDSGTEGNLKFLGDIKDENGKDVSVYMDVSKIEVNDTKRKFWIRYVADEKTKDEYIRQVGYWEVDCKDRTLYRLAEEYYSPDSQLVGKTDERVKEEYKSEQSLGAKMAAAACRYGGR